MNPVLLVWDQEYPPYENHNSVLYWNSYKEDLNSKSLPNYLEENALELRNKYLSFIADLGFGNSERDSLIDKLDIGDGISYWYMTTLVEKSPFKSKKIYQCLLLLSLEKYITENKIKKLVFCTQNKELAKSVNLLCKKTKIELEVQLNSKIDFSFKNIISRYLLEEFKGLLSILKRYLKRRILIHSKKIHWKQGEKSAFFFSYLIHLDEQKAKNKKFYSNQWTVLPEYLYRNNWKVNWIHHYLPSDIANSPEQGLNLLKDINKNTSQGDFHTFLDSFLSIKVVLKALKSWLFLSLKSRFIINLKDRFNVRESNLNLWEILKEDWYRSTSGSIAASNCLWVILFDVALAQVPRQNLGLYLCENQSWEMAMLTSWKKHSHGKIIGFQHATAPFWHLYYFHDERFYSQTLNQPYPLPDNIAVNGQLAYQEFTSSGYPISKITKVEALRYLEDSTINELSNNLIRKKRSKAVNILFLGELNLTGMKKNYEILKETIRELPSHFNFSYKPHPGLVDDITLWEDIGFEIVNDSLPNLLKHFDIIISGNSTTASLEAYLEGLSIVIFLDGNDFNMSPLRSEKEVSFISSSEELLRCLLSIDPTKNRTSHQKKFFYQDPTIPKWKNLINKI